MNCARPRRHKLLIGDLLLLTTLERPASPSRMQPCDQPEISGEACEACSEAAAAAGVTLLHKVEATDTRVLGNEAELNRLLINLLSNALQHSPAGSTVRVSLDLPASLRSNRGGSLSGSIASIPPAVASRGARGWGWPLPRRSPGAITV